MKNFKITDLRKTKVFPDLDYRFSRIVEDQNKVVLERDYLGENPLHYYIDIINQELIIANNILTIKEYLESKGKSFVWEHVRAVSNNTRIKIDNKNFSSISREEEEIDTPLYNYELKESLDYRDLKVVGRKIRELLLNSIKKRLNTIKEKDVGLLLSGGLDSMSVGYLLSKNAKKKITAFTLKVSENNKDVVKSRMLTQHFGINLVEVKLKLLKDNLDITIQKYDSSHQLLYERKIEEKLPIDYVIEDSLKIAGNPKKDNIFCSIAMYLISKAIKSEGINMVFCGEGPNEMLNDYGFDPKINGYLTEDKGNLRFREALTFGLKKTDRQLGRGGLAKHALVRMAKMFATQNIRLESPWFEKDIARIMTKIPHLYSYDTIKQHLITNVFLGEGLDEFIIGTSKEKFQDGSGVSSLLKNYDQKKLLNIFEKIFGIKKNSYLKD